MNRDELVRRAKAILAEAYEEAAEMVVLYLADHRGEARQSLCKEIDPENWAALDARVRRLQAREAASDVEPEPTRTLSGSRVRHAKSALEAADDDVLDDIVGSLPADRRVALGRAVERDGAQEAVDTSFDVQVAKALTQLARVDVLRREGKTFTNLNATKAKRLDRDLEQGIETLVEVRGLVPSAGVRAA